MSFSFVQHVMKINAVYIEKNLELKIKARDLNMTLVTFWILLAAKCPLENYSKPYGCTTAMPPAWGLKGYFPLVKGISGFNFFKFH